MSLKCQYSICNKYQPITETIPKQLLHNLDANAIKKLILNYHCLQPSSYAIQFQYNPCNHRQDQSAAELTCQRCTSTQNIKRIRLEPAKFEQERIIRSMERDNVLEQSKQESSLAFEEASNVVQAEDDYMESEPQCPPYVCGQIKLCRMLKCFYREVVAQLNPDICVINLYETVAMKKPFLSFALSSILKIKRLKRKPCLSNNEYLWIVTAKREITLTFFDRETCIKWMQFLKQGIIFAQYYEARLSLCEDKLSFGHSPVKKKTGKVLLNDSISFENKITYQSKNKSSSSEENKTLSEYVNPQKQSVLLEHFEVGNKIGSGSYGCVYLCNHKRTGNKLALKQLSKQTLIQKRMLRYAVTELEILKIVSCPFVVKLSYAFQTRDYLYMALTYCENGTLKSLIRREGRLSIGDSILYLCELILAVEYLHSKNILYRDMKPDNVLIAADYHIMLSDFGLSKTKFKDTDKAYSFCGSPNYLAPELLINHCTNKMADIYGIGAVFYQMLHGHPLYEYEDVTEMFEAIKSRELMIDESLPTSVKDFLKKILQKDPKRRLKNIKDHKMLEKVNWKSILEKKFLPKYNKKPDSKILSDNTFHDDDYNDKNYIEDRVEGWLFSHNDKYSIDTT